MNQWYYHFHIAAECGSESHDEPVRRSVGADLFFITHTNCWSATGCVHTLCQTRSVHLDQQICISDFLLGLVFLLLLCPICLQLVMSSLNNSCLSLPEITCLVQNYFSHWRDFMWHFDVWNIFLTLRSQQSHSDLFRALFFSSLFDSDFKYYKDQRKNPKQKNNGRSTEKYISKICFSVEEI